MKGTPLPEVSETKRVGIWIRVSTEDQAKGESPEHHERRARYYAESRGWHVREVYHLEAVSGKSVKDHPEAQRMLGHVKSGHITGLIFSKLARLARNTKELLEFADLFREHEADLVSLQEAIDTSTPAGRLFYTMIAGMAQWEREEIAERVAASVHIRAKLGKPTGGAAPYGYRWENRTLVPDPTEAPVRKLMYDLFLEHRRKKTVADRLNKMGYRTRNGSRFSDTTVERLLRDPMARGLRRANYTRSLGQRKKWVLKPEGDWVLSRCEPIVSEEIWNQCNAILDQRRNGRRPAKKPTHLFAGLTFCECGRKMYAEAWGKYVCRGCRNKIAIDDLEAIFEEQLKGFFLSPVEMATHLAEADESIRGKEELLKTLEVERQRVRSEMDKILRLYLDDKISADGFGLEYRPLEERLKAFQDEIPTLQGEVDFLKINYLSREEILSEAKDLYARFQDLGPEEKRRIVETITERIEVGKDGVTITLCYLPAAPSPSKNAGERQHNLTGSSRPRAGSARGTSPSRGRARP